MNGVTLPSFLTDQLADTETAWSIGTFGAIAEFTRGAHEEATFTGSDSVISVVTVRGGLRIEACRDPRPIASESPTAESWSHRVALCLPKDVCAMSRRTVLTELGPDRDALRQADRDSILFDLGLGALQVDACVRCTEPAVALALRKRAGQSLFTPGNDAMAVILAANPHRVFVSRVGRIEVFQPIPPPDGKSPDGPHTHVLPKLLRHNRTHAATEHVPPGLVPCAHFYPPHPVRDAFGRRRPFHKDSHESIQALLARFGDPRLLRIKQRVIEAVAAGDPPSAISVADDRFGRAVLRVALRQLKMSGKRWHTLDAWLSTHDHPGTIDVEEDHPCTA